jgi:thiol-disulfide isomerase/thioredoxin
MKKTLLIIASAVLALSAGISARHLISTSQKANQTPLPEFSLPDLAGQPHSIREWQGKILVINFWATWCPPCIREIPEFTALQQAYSDKNLTFIGIAMDDREEVNKFIATTPINYPTLLTDENGIQLTRKLGNLVDAVPFTVVVNQQGQIIHTHPGEFSKKQLIEVITPLIQ